MSRTIFRLAAALGALALAPHFASSAPAQTAPAQAAPAKPVLTGFPFTNESLSYTVNWPSGLSLGEAHLSAAGTATGWHFELALDAAIPGFAVKDIYRGTATAGLCSESLSKDYVHGSRKDNETITIDQTAGIATRTPANGVGGAKITVPPCVHDALTYLFYARRELGQGRVPVPQEVIFGAMYSVSLEYAGAATIDVGTKRVLTDKMICHVRGPASDFQFDAYFDRDPARTPVLIRVPLSMGKFSLEIVR